MSIGRTSQPPSSEAVPAGSFLLFCSKSRGLLASLSRSNSGASHRLEAVLRASRGKATAQDGQQQRSAGPVSSIALGGGAMLVVHPALHASPLVPQRVEPVVHYDGAQLACVFTGHLENLGELAARYDAWGGGEGGPSSPRAVASDARALAAATLCAMYAREHSAGDLTVLLSELQGHFTFALYDSGARQLFAARDSRADSAPLYYELSEDGSLTLSNVQLLIPAEVGLVHWTELPPGHMLAGRPPPRVTQFALTPAQLSWREQYEYSLEEELSAPRVGRGGSGLPAEFSKHLSTGEDDDDDGVVGVLLGY